LCERIAIRLIAAGAAWRALICSRYCAVLRWANWATFAPWTSPEPVGVCRAFGSLRLEGQATRRSMQMHVMPPTGIAGYITTFARCTGKRFMNCAQKNRGAVAAARHCFTLTGRDAHVRMGR